MQFSSATNQCEDEIVVVPTSVSASTSAPVYLSTSRVLSYTAPPQPQVQYGAKYNEITQDSQGPRNVNVPELRIPGKKISLGGRCKVGYDLCPDNAHCLLGICVCKPGFLYRATDESCRDRKV